MTNQAMTVRRPQKTGSGMANPTTHILTTGASPALGAAEGAGWGAFLGGALGLLIGHVSSSAQPWRDAGIGAGVGALAIAVAGYYAAKDNPAVSVAPNGQYTVSVPTGGTLTLNVTGGILGSVSVNNSAGGSGAAASLVANGVAQNGLSSGVNTLNLSWQDASSNSQTATVQATVS